MAGLMSGLTLGFMSLDEVDLEVMKRSGSTHQKQCAEKILPVIAKPHRLLVTLLVCNAIAAEALPICLDRLTDPITAIVISVTVVLIFGEIIPQAACSAYGLEIGAQSSLFVQLLMFITSPLAIPIAWVLDKILGHRQTALFRRAELKALVDIHGEGQQFGGQLTTDEVRIIKGALDLTNKRAKAAMTPLDMVFMLPLDATLDESTLTAVLASGHSRIPVHRPGNRSDIVGILLVKELILVDINAGIKVSAMKVRSLPHLLGETPMYDMLKLFELGRSHMAVLTQPTKEALARLKAEAHEVAIDLYSISDDDFGSDDDGDGDSDDVYGRRQGSTSSSSGASGPCPPIDVFSIKFQPRELQPAGIITIEDVLEELLGAEIIDETDQFVNVEEGELARVDAAALAHALPPHLQRALTSWTITPRIGPALQVYRMASGSVGEGNLMLGGRKSGEHAGSGDGDGIGGGGGAGPSASSAAGSGAGGVVTTTADPSITTTTTTPSPPTSLLAAATAERFASHLPRVLHPSKSPDRVRYASKSVGSNLANIVGVRSFSRRPVPPRGYVPERRSTNVTQAVQEQLNLLQPLLDARRRAKMEAVGEDGGGSDTEIHIESSSMRRAESSEQLLRRENSI